MKTRNILNTRVSFEFAGCRGFFLVRVITWNIFFNSKQIVKYTFKTSNQSLHVYMHKKINYYFKAYEQSCSIVCARGGGGGSLTHPKFLIKQKKGGGQIRKSCKS